MSRRLPELPSRVAPETYPPAQGRIRFAQVTKRFRDDTRALTEVSLEIDPGEFTFVTGPSGAGKTTLLSLIYGAMVPTSGTVLVNGRNVGALPVRKIPYLRRTIGVVFQDSRLIRRKTALENVAYLPRILGLPTKEQRRLAQDALARVGLAHRMNAFPEQLSGGEQQRVAIARAVVNRPSVLLADEPTGNLDPDLSREIFELFAELNGTGTTVLVATHDHSILKTIGGRILSLKEGRLAGDERRGPEPYASADTGVPK
ncbi:MAG: cell division ATP-binding protein FtsE [Thermoanaerobaculia bacterium]